MKLLKVKNVFLNFFFSLSLSFILFFHLPTVASSYVLPSVCVYNTRLDIIRYILRRSGESAMWRRIILYKCMERKKKVQRTRLAAVVLDRKQQLLCYSSTIDALMRNSCAIQNAVNFLLQFLLFCALENCFLSCKG
jgi:hypothetical protein